MYCRIKHVRSVYPITGVVNTKNREMIIAQNGPMFKRCHHRILWVLVPGVLDLYKHI